jgi:hypothetical protein
MNRRRLRLFSLAALLLFVLSVVGFAQYSSVAKETRSSTLIAGDPALKEIANYRHWTRVNDIPLPVSLSLVSGASLTGATLFAGG